MNKTVAIAGLGWLGQPLAFRLANSGYTVKGSVSTIEKATLLQQNNFDAFPIELSETGITGPVKAFLKDSDYLIIMIPPGLRRNTGANYVQKMSNFLDEINQAQIKKVILVSSTSVYDDSQGVVTEDDAPQPQTKSGKQLFEVERIFQDSEEFETTVVRFGGLYGGSRQPAKYLAGRKDLNDRNAPVNLINRQDCINILTKIIKKDAFGYVFNAVNPSHPKKAEFYIRKAKEMGLEPPVFAEDDSQENTKQVDSVNLEKILDYQFKSQLV